jgi:hypothetical protein
MEGKQYIGVHLDWDYNKRELITSMQGYTEQALKELEHPTPSKPIHAPSKVERPNYGAIVQYAPVDDSPPLDKKRTKFVQTTTGKFLYYGRCVDITMQHGINDIAASGFKGSTHEATLHFLNYAATHPDARVIYRASDMILHVDSDAAYLVCAGARSRAGGYHYLSDKDNTVHNGPVFVLAKIIKNVMSSAAEAETGALFMNAQDAIPIRQCLIDLGHPQPPTPIKTDNSTAQGYVNGTIKQKMSKSWDMRFRWLKNREAQQQFKVQWEPGKNNLADYVTKHHTAAHHQNVRPIYIYDPIKSPATVQGCIEILSKGPTKNRNESTPTTPKTGEPTPTTTKTGEMGLKLSHILPLTKYSRASAPHDSILTRCRVTTHTQARRESRTD